VSVLRVRVLVFCCCQAEKQTLAGLQCPGNRVRFDVLFPPTDKQNLLDLVMGYSPDCNSLANRSKTNCTHPLAELTYFPMA
jgi:hypothetical protein